MIYENTWLDRAILKQGDNLTNFSMQFHNSPHNVCSVQGGGCSIQWESSVLRGNHEYRGGYLQYRERYLEYTLRRYHDTCGEYHMYCWDVQYHEGTQITKNYPLTLLNTPMVLITSPTELKIPHVTEHPMVLSTPHGTKHTLYRFCQQYK